MLLNKCNFFSKVLASHVDVDILLPSLSDNDAYLAKSLTDVYRTKKYPVLYLLHGALDDHTMWLRHSLIEEYAEQAEIAVVMPSGQNMFYTNAKYGLNYFDFIAKELPLMVRTYFPISTEREHSFIAGPSMGGYGASKCALRCPDQYAAFADLSGAVDPVELKPLMESMGFDFFRYDLIWGNVENEKGSDDDVYKLADDLAGKPDKPKAYIYCGEDDPNNYEMNYRFYQRLTEDGFTASFQGGPGVHDFRYWDRCISDFIKKIIPIS